MPGVVGKLLEEVDDRVVFPLEALHEDVGEVLVAVGQKTGSLSE